MDITEVTIVHHIALVLLLLWVLVQLGKGHPVVFFVALLYLYKVNERYTLRLQKRLQFEERKFANQRRLLSDAESVRWLNHAIEKIWPVCMEQIASQQFLLPIIPWFLDKFKPWTARKAVMQHLYLGRNPPMFIDARVLRESSDDDHLVLELGMNFLSADDMSAKLAVQLRKRLGFGITANMHITGMHVEGKVLVGVKFLRQWPFIGRVRVCFVEPPYFQMTVKPIFGHGVDVTELPGISGWLDKLLDVAFGQTLVEPNMLVIDVEKFVLAPEEGWFTVNVKPPIGYAKLEMLEGAGMKPSDFNGLSDPYVKGQLGPYRFQTKIQRKTLFPKWLEEFKIPISSWEGTNVLVLQVRDKDTIFDDILGNCSVNINDLRGGQRHDMWLSLQNVKMGRIHLAITVLEEELQKEQKDLSDEEISKTTEPMTSRSDEKAEKLNTEEYHHKMADEFEPINIKGQEKTGLWVHRPGSDVSQKWEPRKGRARYPDTHLHREDNGSTKPPSRSSSSRSQQSDSSSHEESADGKKPRLKIIKKGLHKLSSVFHRSPRKGSPRQCQKVVAPPPPPNLRPIGEKRTSIKVIMPDGFDEKKGVPKLDEERCNSEISERESPGKGSMLQTPKNFISKSSKSLKSVLSRKDSDKLKEVQSPGAEDNDNSQGTNSSSDGLVDDPLVIGGLPISIASCSDKVTVSAEDGSVRSTQDDKKDNI